MERVRDRGSVERLRGQITRLKIIGRGQYVDRVRLAANQAADMLRTPLASGTHCLPLTIQATRAT